MQGLRGVTILTAFLLAACGQQQQQAEKPPPPGVVVSKAERRDLKPAEQFNGRVEAKDQVDILARVEGFIQSTDFQDGQLVQAGQRLFLLEQAPFQATVQQREADLARAQAEARNAQVQFERARQLLRTGNIPQSEADRREATYLTTAAQVKQAQAALDAASIDLGYTDIRAPIAGRIGKANFTDGALVGPRAASLATIVNNDPIYVTFPVSQRQLLDFREKGEEQGRQQKVAVRLRLANGAPYAQPGEVDFLDIKADPGTDTITVRARFANAEGLLVPGQFASVTVESAQPVSSLVVPQAALQIDQAGPFVMVVDGEHRIEMRRVRTGAAEGSGVVVEQGLNPGDQVVVEGVQKVRPGQEVQVSEQPAEPVPTPGGNPS